MSDIALSHRTVVLADVTNLFFGAKNAFPGVPCRVNYAKLLGGVLAGRPLLKALAFMTQKSDVEQSKFHDALARCGFELRLKSMQIQPSHGPDKIYSKASWEVGLTLEALYLASKADVVVIVTGDSAYAPLVQELRARKYTFGYNCFIEVVGFRNAMSDELIHSANKVTYIPQEWTITEQSREERPRRVERAAPALREMSGETSVGEQRVAQLVGGIDYDEQQPISNVPPRLVKRHS